MANKVEIDVGAKLDTSQVAQQINAWGQQIAQASKTQFKPVSPESLRDVQKMVQAMNQLLLVNGDLAKRMAGTNQKGMPWDLNYNRMYSDPNSAVRQMRKHFEYVVGRGHFSASRGLDPTGGPGPMPGAAGGSGDGNKPPPWWQQVGRPVVGQLPGGGIVGGAVSTGMSAGFGAGMMGLLGGILALGVGKAVGAVMDGVDAAEQNAIALDKLKRSLGDVNVGFEQLKTVVRGGSDMAKIGYPEATRLVSEFVRAGNIKNSEFGGLGSDLAFGVGFSRSLGLDPSQGMGALGQVRGVGYTGNQSEDRRFAALIGEAVGKSEAFAKADEVMDAIAGFVVMQTRQGLTRANASGFAGAFAALVGSGMPGMDPAGAAALLGRVNASLTGGGSKGEASQFFSAIIGQKMGLDPFQTQVLREGGAFATIDNTFGGGSPFGKYVGKPGGGAGGQTWLGATLGALRSYYGKDKRMLAMATANHLGVSMRQAIAMLEMDPKQMGELGADFDLTKMNDTAIGNLAKVRYGKDSDREAIRQSLMGRKDVSDADKVVIEKGDRKALEQMVAKYGQESTQGSDIRDSKTALENIKIAIADKALPLFQAMRDGIVWMAGGGNKTALQIAEEVKKLDYRDKESAVRGRFGKDRAGVVSEIEAAVQQVMDAEKAVRDGWSTMSPEERDKAMQRAKTLRENLPGVQEGLRRKLLELNGAEERQLQALREARDKEIEGLRQANEEREKSTAKPGDPETTGSINPTSFSGAGAGRGSGFDLRRTDYGPIDPARKEEAMKFFMDKGWSKEQAAGIVANLWAESNLREGAIGDRGQAYGIGQWHGDRQAMFRKVFGKDMQGSSRFDQYAFVDWELRNTERAAGLALSHAGSAAEAGAIVSGKYERPARNEGWSRGHLAERIMGLSSASQNTAIGTTPGMVTGQMEVILKNDKGQETHPRQVVPVKIKSNGHPALSPAQP